jgi:hypothetical protein
MRKVKCVHAGVEPLREVLCDECPILHRTVRACMLKFHTRWDEDTGDFVSDNCGLKQIIYIDQKKNGWIIEPEART